MSASRWTASPRSARSPGAAGAHTRWPPAWRASTAAGAAPPCRSADAGNDRAPADRIGGGSGAHELVSGPVAELVLLARTAGARSVARRLLGPGHRGRLRRLGRTAVLR